MNNIPDKTTITEPTCRTCLCIVGWLVRHPNLGLTMAVLVMLGFFLNKPFHMDDPLFVWAAKQIHAQPGDPYGFQINWYGTVTRMSEVTMNPPLACYYLAAAAAVFGWSEAALHGAFLFPALAVILGTYRLAKHFCNHPLLAAGASLLTPVFLVSSTTVMCDVLMLAFWVWAIVFWVEGQARNSFLRLSASALLIVLAVGTKYYAISLIPLLATYSLLALRRLGWWSITLLIPVAALLVYHWRVSGHYGVAPLADAAKYVTLAKGISEFLVSKPGNCLVALSFMGGCLAMVTFFMPMLWRPRQLMTMVLLVGLVAVGLFSSDAVLKDYGPIQGSSRVWIQLQLVFWAIGGVGILALAINDIWLRRDADAWMLGLWVIGTFLFAALVNWTVNGRTILPMAPAVAILLIRRLERNAIAGGKLWSPGAALGLAAGAAIALWVAWADFCLAKSARESAQVTFAKFGSVASRFWYQGHWGFQYYMDTLGANALDAERTLLQRGDIIATPENNTNFSPLGPDLVVLREMITVSGPGLITTMKGEVGAGFYAANRGPLPFAFGLVPGDRIAVCVVDPLAPPTQPGASDR